jgi:hypothetical protein
MNSQQPDLNPKPAKTDYEKTNESVQREGSELLVDQRSSYLRSRQIALKKFSPQGRDPSWAGRYGPRILSFRLSGVNLNSPQTEEARRRIRPAYLSRDTYRVATLPQIPIESAFVLGLACAIGTPSCSAQAILGHHH